MDAILVGIGTVLADDPLLTARPPGPRTPMRIILDSHGRLPPQSRLVQTVHEAPLLLVTMEDNAAIAALHAAGCEVLNFSNDGGRPAVAKVLEALGKRRMTNILVEGGAEVLGSFFDAALVDEVWTFIAPIIAGGAGKSPVAGRGAENTASALSIADWRMEAVDYDVLLHGACPR
jgi:diaminohydroxyphosphoribosylaminopyrimidine deaminase / 5-amino-6-(5-phosphoribosylamino)uracil reductase